MFDFIQNLFAWKNTLGIAELITIPLSIATLVCTIIIPIRIMNCNA